MILAAADSFWLGLGLADWAVLAVYFVVILVIGIWSARRVKDMADFFMGGRRFGKVFMMFFAFGAGTSSEQAISVVAGTWRVGLAGIWWQFLWLWATPFYWIVAPIMRRMRALTTADFFEARYNAPTATLYSVYGIVMAIVFIAGGLYSSGKMINALTGGELEVIAAEADLHVPALTWDDEAKSVEVSERRVQGYEFAILAMTVLFVAYGMAGGLGAAIITDFIQGVLTITFSFLLLPFVFQMIGGFGALGGQSGIKKGMLDLFTEPEVAAEMATSLGREPITGFYVFMLSLTALAGIVAQPHIMGVCGAGKTEFEGRFGFTVGNFLKRFCTVAWTFTGLACIVWYLGDASPLRHAEQPTDAASPEFQQLDASLQEQIQEDRALHASLTQSVDTEALKKLPKEEQSEIVATDKSFADDLFGRAAFDILPTIAPGLIGLLMASLLAAVMSTSDAQMIISSGLFTENIYRRWFIKNRSQKHYLWVGRIAGLLIVLLALLLQSTFTDVIDALKVIIKTPACIGISLWFGITWRRWNTWAVWFSTAAGIACWTLVAFYPDRLQEHLGALFPDSAFRDAAGKVTMADAWQMFCYISATLVVGLVVSFLTPRQSKEKLDHFYLLVHTPVTPGEVVETPCTLPENPAAPTEKLFDIDDIELQKPTFVGLGGFVLAWCGVAAVIWLTHYLSQNL
ncbi:MAG: hypothetical protein CMJ48_02445 [Planctomycetaceae bacterium]|nr:hypothetical protein [Planctomycetaceae bacterium]